MGDSGMTRHTITSATRPMRALTANSTRHEKSSTIRSAAMPGPPPTPSVNETTPIATLHCLSGNSSRVGEREDGRAHALHAAEHDQGRGVPGDHRAERAHEEHREADGHGHRAVLVARPAKIGVMTEPERR